LWDWLQLFFIPAAIAFGVWWLNRLQQQRDQQIADRRAKREQELATDSQHEAALQAYIDNMSALLLENDLSNRVKLDKVRKIGRVRTLTVLRRCDGKRKAIVLQFLCESDLINKDNTVVGLEGADFSEAELFRAQLSKADLSRANLTGANLMEANLIEAKLCSTILNKADLRSAKLFGADLRGVDLREADLRGAIVIPNEELEKEASSLKGTAMPDGTKHA